MKLCDGWPHCGCRNQATELWHGYELCADCGRKFNAPDPHDARTRRILAAHAPQAVDADLQFQAEEQDYICERQIAQLRTQLATAHEVIAAARALLHELDASGNYPQSSVAIGVVLMALERATR